MIFTLLGYFFSSHLNILVVKARLNGQNFIIERIIPFKTVYLSTLSRELHQSYFAISFKENS